MGRPGNGRFDALLLPAVREIRATWRMTRGGAEVANDTSLWGIVSMCGSLQLGYAFASLFVPDFVEVDGALILAEHYQPTEEWQDNFQRWRGRCGGDLSQVERMLNHTHVYDLFGDEDPVQELLGEPARQRLPQPPDQVRRTFLGVLAATWRGTVAARFPGEDIRVVTDPDENEGGVITVYRVRQESGQPAAG